MSDCTKRYRSEEISPWGEGEFWKKHKGVLFQCPTLKIGRHFLYWHPNLSIQLKCTVNFKSRRILAERRFLEDFFWTVFFFRKQDWQTLKAIKSKGQIMMKVIFWRKENSFSHFYRQLASWLAIRAPCFFPKTVCNHYSLWVPPLR